MLGYSNAGSSSDSGDNEEPDEGVFECIGDLERTFVGLDIGVA